MCFNVNLLHDSNNIVLHVCNGMASLHHCVVCSHMFQVMANGETFGRSLVLSPSTNTPNTSVKPSRNTSNRSQNTPKSSLYRRLSARLSGRRSSPNKLNAEPEDGREQRLQRARNSIKCNQSKDEPDNSIFSYVGKSFIDDLCSSGDRNQSTSQTDGVELRQHKNSGKENKYASQAHIESRLGNKDKREVFRNKSMNVFNLVECLTEAGSLHSSLTKSLCDLDCKEDTGFLLPASAITKELQHSTTTISSGKKRSRNSTESNFQVSLVDANISPDKCDESNWKSIKRLKIKDSFKFKNRPTIFKKTKKESVSKAVGDITVEPVSPDNVKPTDPAGEFLASTSSPIREDDNASICSLNISKQSGFFDISFASIRSSKTVKSASKLRRSVKSFTASFRSERKKKYEKRAERNTVEVNPCHLPAELKNVSTPKRELDEMNLDISPVQVDTIDSTDMRTPHKEDTEADECDESVVFKTPQRVWLRTHRHSICGGADLKTSLTHPSSSLPAVPSLPVAPSLTLAPSPRPVRDQPPPASTPPTRDARAISQCHGLSLPVLTPFNSVLLNFRLSCHAVGICCYYREGFNESPLESIGLADLHALIANRNYLGAYKYAQWNGT